MTAKATVNPAELLDQAASTYFGAVKNGLKVQEDLATRWVEMFRKADGGEFLPQAFQQAVKETVPLVQKQTDEVLKLIENSTRQSLNLMSEAFEAGRTTKPAEAQARLEKLWENSLTALRDNAEAIVRANAHLMESWAGIAKKNVERVVAPGSKAA